MIVRASVIIFSSRCLCSGFMCEARTDKIGTGFGSFALELVIVDVGDATLWLETELRKGEMDVSLSGLSFLGAARLALDAETSSAVPSSSVLDLLSSMFLIFFQSYFALLPQP